MRVLNARRVGLGWVPGRVRIDRSGPWGNPFLIGRDGSREEVIARHAEWLPGQTALMARLHELAGCDLLCWCHPLPCHGHTIRRMVLARWPEAGCAPAGRPDTIRAS